MDLGEDIFFEGDGTPQLPEKQSPPSSSGRDEFFRPKVGSSFKSYHYFYEEEREVMQMVERWNSFTIKRRVGSSTSYINSAHPNVGPIFSQWKNDDANQCFKQVNEYYRDLFTNKSP